MPYKNDKEQKMYYKEYYKKHKEKILKRIKKYNQIHKKEKKEYKKIYYQEHREERKTLDKKYRLKRREEIKEYSKKYYQKHREAKKKYRKEYNKEHKDEIRAYRQKHKKEIIEYRQRHKEKLQQYKKEYRQKNKQLLRVKSNNYIKERKKSDINFKLKTNVHSSIIAKFKRELLTKNNLTTFGNLLTYNPSDLRQYLENKFEPWMNVNNYGNKQGMWTIDHVIPQNFFKFANPDGTLNLKEIRKCWALENLQPMEWYKNCCIKKDKII